MKFNRRKMVNQNLPDNVLQCKVTPEEGPADQQLYI
jgi:hypothetical protein